MRRNPWPGVILACMLSSNTTQAGPAIAPCPDSPNCVSSQATDEQHFIEPQHFTGDPGTAWSSLNTILQQLPRVRIVAEQDNYLHAEFRSRVFRFVDDVEFVMQADQGVIHVRSASRTGYSDLGVNRRRIEQIRGKFAASKPPG